MDKSPQSSLPVAVLQSLWGGVVFCAVELWGWRVLSTVASLALAYGMSAMYGDQYIAAACAFFIGLTLFTARAVAESRTRKERPGVAAVLVLLGVGIFAASLWLVKHTYEGKTKNQTNILADASEWTWRNVITAVRVPWRWVIPSVLIAFIVASLVHVLRERKGNRITSEAEAKKESSDEGLTSRQAVALRDQVVADEPKIKGIILQACFMLDIVDIGRLLNIVLKVRLKNHGTPTVIEGFRLTFLYMNEEYQNQQTDPKGYRFLLSGTTLEEDIVDLRDANDVRFGKHDPPKIGWLAFRLTGRLKGIPSSVDRLDGNALNEVRLRLEVTDGAGTFHLISEGPPVACGGQFQRRPS